MNVSDFIQILQKSNTILSPKQTRELEDIIEEYPYFQAARALHLKGLKNLDSYKYNSALKVVLAGVVTVVALFLLATFCTNNQKSKDRNIMSQSNEEKSKLKAKEQETHH